MSTAEETFAPYLAHMLAEHEKWENKLAPHREGLLGVLRSVHAKRHQGQPFDEEGVWAKLVEFACNRRGASDKPPASAEHRRILDATAHLRALLDVDPWPSSAVEDTIKALDCLSRSLMGEQPGPAKRGPKGSSRRYEILALARIYREATGAMQTTTGPFAKFVGCFYTAMGTARDRETWVKAIKKVREEALAARRAARSAPIEAEEDDEED